MIHHVTVYDYVSDTIVLDFDTKFDSLEQINSVAYDHVLKKFESYCPPDAFDKLFYVHVVY